MSKNLVSIVIPTYKGIDSLERAVDSALKQTYENIEVIIVDDNGLGTESQIRTEQIVSKYTSNKNVSYIKHDININGSAARNTGIRESKGEYIAFLDDDDIYLPHNIERHIERLDSLSSAWGMSYCGFELHLPNGRKETIMPKFDGEILTDFFKGKIRIGSSLIVIRRQVLNDVIGFDESFKRHQDWEFIARISESYKVASVREICVVKINLNRNSASSPKQYEMFRLYYLEKMARLIKKLPDSDQKEIYLFHYASIGIACLKDKDFKMALYWAKETRHPVKVMMFYLFSFLRYTRKIIVNKID